MLLFVAFFASVIVPKGTYGALRLDALGHIALRQQLALHSGQLQLLQRDGGLLAAAAHLVTGGRGAVLRDLAAGRARASCTSPGACARCSRCAVRRPSGRRSGCTCSTAAALNTNRAYLGTDTRSQCLFIGCALAVGLVLLTQRRHEEGRLAKGELWRPEGETGRMLCGVVGVVGAAGAVAIWVLTTSTSLVPLLGRVLPHRPGGGRRHPGGRRGTAQHRPAAPVAGAGALRGPDLLRALHLALADLHLAQPRPHGAVGLRALRAARPGDLRRLGGVLPPRRAPDPRWGPSFASGGPGWPCPPGWAPCWWQWWRRRRGPTAAAPAGAPGRHRHHRPTTTTTTTSPRSPPSTAPPVRVLLFGDSVAAHPRAGALGHASSRTSTTTSLSDNGILGCGVVDGPEVELMGPAHTTPPACNGSAAASHGEPSGSPSRGRTSGSAAINEVKPNVVVLLAGRWEVVDREYQGQLDQHLEPDLRRLREAAAGGRPPSW